MSLDEQPIRSLSGTASVWSHASADQSSGASTHVVTTFSTLRRPTGSATMSDANGNGNGAQHPPSHVYAHRQAQSQAQQNLPSSQNQTIVATTGIHNGNVAFPDGARGPKPAVLRDQGVRKFGPAAIPIVRPSPASQATVGAIGDGRKRAAPGNSNLSERSTSSEVEQTAVLFRSLDITPPLSAQSVNSSATTSISQGSSVEPPCLRIDPYGQYSTAPDHIYPRRSMFDPFLDSVDTPLTQSPTTPDRYDQFDPPAGFSPFDLEGGFLSRHNSQEAMDNPYPFHGKLPREGNLSLLSANTVSQANPVMVPNAALNGPPDALAIRVCQTLLSGYQGPLEGLSFSAANSNVSAMSNNFQNATGSAQTYSGANQRAIYSIPFSPPVNRNDTQFSPMHEPAPYLRSPSPYWRYLPASRSESLPGVPRDVILGTAVTLDGDSGSTAESMKQDGWVTSTAGYHDMVHEKPAVHRTAAPSFPVGGSWSGGLAPWSTQHPQSDGNISRNPGLGTTSVTGYQKNMASLGIAFSSRSTTLHHGNHESSCHGDSAFDVSSRSSNALHSSINDTPPWSLGSASVSSPGGSLSDGHKVHQNFPKMSRSAPSFIPSSTPAPDIGMPQFLSQVQSMSMDQARSSFSQPRFGGSRGEGDENINFLQLLQPDARPPYTTLVNRIVRKSDQQASIFIQQKLKNASAEERSRIVNAIVERGLDMMQGRFGNWCVQRCLESPCSREDRMKIVECMTGHIVEMATNCYGTHVVQKALECEEDIKRIIVNELLENDPAFTLTSKHCSHVWAKVMELSWHEGPPPPIFKVVNQSLRGKWASLACHETGSLVVQTMFENMDEAEDKRIIVDEILDNLDVVVKDQWGAFVIQHIIEHGNAAVSHRTSLSLINNMAIYGTHDIAVKSILKILKEKNPLTQEAAVTKMCEPNINANRNKRPIIVDLALSSNGSQLIQAVLPDANKDQRAHLYDAVKGHTVTLRGCKTGSRVIWLFDRMRAYYGY